MGIVLRERVLRRRIVQRGAGGVVKEGDGGRRPKDRFIGGGAAKEGLLMILLGATLWEEEKQERFGVFWPNL